MPLDIRKPQAEREISYRSRHRPHHKHKDYRGRCEHSLKSNPDAFIIPLREFDKTVFTIRLVSLPITSTYSSCVQFRVAILRVRKYGLIG